VKAASDIASGAVGKRLTSGRHEQCSERHGGHDINKEKKQTMPRAWRRERRRLVKETSDTASGVACNPTGERKSGEKSGRHAVDEGKKQAIQRAAWRISRRREETNDTVGAAAGKTSTRERNK
jgi:hypothetical protein